MQPDSLPSVPSTEPAGQPSREAEPRIRTDPLAHLAERAAEGDAAAMHPLLQALVPLLLSSVRAILGRGGAAAEDVTQEALVGFVHALGAFRGDCTVLHYATRIAVRTAIAARRREVSDRERLAALHLSHTPLDEAPPSPRDEAIAAKKKAIVRSLLDELPDIQADTLAMRVVLGYSMQEVADATGAPVNTVRSRLRLAKEALRHRIEADPHIAEFLGFAS
jgi:RNA polymerase sigma factor (sigma-70 family)